MNLLSCSTKGSLHSCTRISCRVLAIRQYSSTQRSKTHYQTLGVPSTASLKEIKAAYIELCKKHHPDANPNDPQAQQKFVKLQEAYNILSSPEERARYDVKTNRASYKTPNYRTAGSSNGDFIRNFYQSQAREQQKRRDMEDWMNQSGKYRDPMDDMLRQENERQRQTFHFWFFGDDRDSRDDQHWSGPGRKMRRDPYWSGRYHYNDYNQSSGKNVQRLFFLILWLCVFSWVVLPPR